MQFQNDKQLITVPTQPPGVAGYKIDVPGKLKWFESGSEEYHNWVTQHNQFIKEIDIETEGGREILTDILDSLLESEIPTGIFGAISVALKLGKKARMMLKRRQLYRNVIDGLLQLTFTAPSNENDEFAFSFYQVQHLWRAFGGGTLPPKEYKKLYSTVDTKLRVGKLKNKIIKFPELDRYVGYKLRQFKDSFHRYQFSLVEY